MPTADQLENEIVATLRRIIRGIDLRSRRLVEEIGLTGPQLLVLREVARVTGGPMAALARSVSLSMPTVSGIVDRLERRGLVRRSRGAEDRRRVAVSLTPQGGRLLRGAPSMLEDRFRSQLAGLEEWEQTQVLATLQRVAWMMDAEALDAAPVLATGPIAGGAGQPPEPADGAGDGVAVAEP